MIYLDNSATTRQDDRVTERMLQVMSTNFGNPSSLHGLGLSAQNLVRNARVEMAASLGASPEEIVFNSGGTEGDNTVIEGAMKAGKHRGRRLITTAAEHPAVLEVCKRQERAGAEVIYLKVDHKCRPDLAQLKEALDEDTVLVSMMAVNNEVGTIFPIREAGKMAREHKALFHTDAVQALGKMDLRDTGADFITVSGHKIHGPKGIGAMYLRKGINLPALLVGGGQEKDRRSGTENVPAIAGLGEAVRLSEKDVADGEKVRRGGPFTGMYQVRQYLLEGLRDGIKDIRINSPEEPAECVASVLNVSFLGTRGEVILHTLEEEGIYVSTGSACSSNKKGSSHVLKAMGLSDKEIEGAIRFSFSRENTVEEMDVVIHKVKQAVERFRRLGSFR